MSRNPPQRLDDSPVKVVVISEDPLAKAGLSSAIEGERVHVEEDAARAEVALWDAGAGADAQRYDELGRLALPTVAVVADELNARAALDAGARGVVMRDQVGPSLVAALSAVRHGLTVLDASLAPLPGKPRRASDGGFDDLTNRETEVLQHLAGGLSNKRIAAELGISEHTAKFHVNSILAKLDADTRTAAVVTALRLGLVLL